MTLIGGLIFLAVFSAPITLYLKDHPIPFGKITNRILTRIIVGRPI